MTRFSEAHPMGLDGVELLMEVEKDFGVTLSDADATRLRVVSDLQDAIVDRLLADPRLLPERLKRIVFLHLQTLLAEQMGIRRWKVRPESRFVDDLGI